MTTYEKTMFFLIPTGYARPKRARPLGMSRAGPIPCMALQKSKKVCLCV